MVDLEDLQPVGDILVAQGKGIKPSAKNHVLVDAFIHCLQKLVFGIARAEDYGRVDRAVYVQNYVADEPFQKSVGGNGVPERGQHLQCVVVFKDVSLVKAQVDGANYSHQHSGRAGTLGSVAG